MGVRTNDPDALETLAGVLPYGSAPSRSPRVDSLYSVITAHGRSRSSSRSTSRLNRFNILYSDATRLARTLDFDELLEAFAANMRLLVAEHARRRVFIHAGAVAWRGLAILIPGRSFSGKSSLVAALVRAGATYYSDEYAVLDARGRLHPFLKPISLREPGRPEQTDVSVESLGGVSGVKPIPVGCIAVTEFRPGARWRPQHLTEGEAALALMANAVAARRDPRTVFATIDRVVQGSTTIKSRRGEAAEVADKLIALCDRG